RELATLAEVVLGAALDKALSEAADETDAADGLAVLAMGKLGARALNYASDLDLVFVYDSARAGDPQRLYAKVARRVLERLDEGRQRVYRVDFRLRPRGRQSSLAVSFDELARYFSEEAQYWERLALSRGRVLFGAGRALSARVAELVERFCYSGGVDAAKTRE